MGRRQDDGGSIHTKSLVIWGGGLPFGPGQWSPNSTKRLLTSYHDIHFISQIQQIHNSLLSIPKFFTPQHTPQKPGAKTITKDTPRTKRNIVAARAKTTRIRYGIAKAMNSETFLCDIEVFMGHYLPKVEDKVLSQVLVDMIKKNVLVSREETTASSTGNVKAKSKGKSKARSKSASATPLSTPTRPYGYTLKGFKPPCAGGKENDHEKHVFAPLASICEAICEALRSVDGVELNGYSVRMCGESNLASDISGCNQRIDACMTTNMDKRLRVTDIIVAFEFKTTRTVKMVIQNRAQIVSHSNHTMNEDPRRKFMFGITIEDGGMSLWYFSRSHSAKSWAFNMVERADLFIKIMVSLFCATDEQLGLNSLVEVLGDGSFVFKFPSSGDNGDATFYQTQGAGSQNRSPTLTGRCTRIWKVRQVDPSNGYAKVGTKVMILKDISLHADARTEDDIQKSLFTDIRDFGNNEQKPWQSQPIVRDFGDEDKESLAHILEGDRFMDFFSPIIQAHAGAPSLPVVPNASFESIRPDPGYQRTKEDEATEPKDPPSPDQFPPKKQCCAGNILALWDKSEHRWQVKLSDLEYAKKFPNEKCTASAVPKRDVQIGLQTPTVVHAYQHDFESIWWTFMWLGAARAKPVIPYQLAKEVFPLKPDDSLTEKRTQLFSTSLGKDSSVLISLPFPLKRSYLIALEELRDTLHSAYLTRNLQEKQEDIGSYSNVISKPFRKFFETLDRSKDAWQSVELIIEQEKVQFTANKRKAVDDAIESRKGGKVTWTSGPPKAKVAAKKATRGGAVGILRTTGPKTRSMTKAAQGRQDIESHPDQAWSTRPAKRARR
ncbi:other/FunK1 protein kinase [Coprinopsis cinerea okayama7|uniref:Other/FunK1 protein kinase n=1 Tax=Coprinopsis cinerea (strain Okayama-7 / 130 / ATCC MYA-4618 / FGSC 9003) TaxID=240176 RepID=A8NAW4_COPC7|nr:other/FunK1 protein kinase [Coprinopsis cinerea okayama7\|eukprot:XP_001831966.2 other/FunK1 protein kinase [Coprinopsis cinerea okayama7\